MTSFVPEVKHDPRGLNELIPTSKRMKQIRKDQDLDESGPMKSYPRTLKERKQILSHEGCESNIQTIVYDDGYSEKVHEREIADCFKVGLKYIPDPSKAVKSIKYLNKKIQGSERWDNLPIYWINGHSNIEMKIILKPPEGMTEEEAMEEMEYDYISQLLENFEIHRAPPALTQKEAATSDLFETQEGVFVAITSPIGYDAQCGDWNQLIFLRQGQKNKFSGLRNVMLSEKYDEMFVHNNPNMITAFTPPHNSALNKTYQFFDEIKEGKDKETSFDKWGVIRLDTIENAGFLEQHPGGIIIKNDDDKLRALNGGTDPRIKRLIEERIKQNSDVSLKEITSILGPGIYLDATCCGLYIKIWDPVFEGGKWVTFGPDSKNNFNRVQPIYDIIMEDFDAIRHQQKLSWSNIVSKGDEVVSTREEQNIINFSNFTASSTTASSASDKSRKKTEKNNEGKEVVLQDDEMPVRLVSVPHDLRSKYTEDGKLKRGGRKTKRGGRKAKRKTKNPRMMKSNTMKKKAMKKNKKSVKKHSKSVKKKSKSVKKKSKSVKKH